MATLTCPSCKSPAAPGSIFCDNCGYDLRNVAAAPMPVQAVPQQAGAACSNCGASNVAGAAFCENCGNPLSQKPQLSYQPLSSQSISHLNLFSRCTSRPSPFSLFTNPLSQ